MLTRFNIDSCKGAQILCRHGLSLPSKECPKIQEGKDMMSRIPYASSVGSLMYAMLCTGPDICFVVGLVSRYQSNLGEFIGKL
jgi:hypothetical protein